MHRLRILGIFAALALLIAACGPAQPPADTFVLTVEVVGDGVVNFDTAAGDDAVGDNNIAKDGEVTLVATPNAGSQFVGWTGDACAGEGATCTFSMDAAKTITATFEAAAAVSDVTVDFTGSDGTGKVTSDAGHDCTFDGTDATGTCVVEDHPTGTAITFTAAPDAGISFSWAGSAAACGTDLECEVTPNSSDFTVTAVFDDPTTPVEQTGSVAVAAGDDDGLEWVTPALNTPGGSEVADDHGVGYTHNELAYSGLSYVNRWSAEVINGFIFRDLGIPAGATITEASIQFTSIIRGGNDAHIPSDNSTEIALVISAEANLTPAAIPQASNAAPLSTRPVVGTTVEWTGIPDWVNKGDTTADQQTVDISALLQAVVDQAGWDESGDANIMIANDDADATVGWRQIATFEEDPSVAPVLNFKYTVP